tara:strand:+ start:445 stop:654 length:210 start_codon:yes stop_codon:yes gene_type:complete
MLSKKRAVRFFGSVEATAHAVGVTGRAVEKWPLQLTQALADRVVGAALRTEGITAAKRGFPSWFFVKRF